MLKCSLIRAKKLGRSSSVTNMGEREKSSGSCVDDGESKIQIVENLVEETKRSRIESAETETDWISKLPDSLIVQILSLLPLKEALRTTILSKRWQYLWTFIDNIIFDWDSRDSWLNFLYTQKEKVDMIISFTDNALRLHSCSSITKFNLSLKCNLDALICSKTDKWIEIALSKKVKNLYLELWPYYLCRTNKGPYLLPQVLCNSDSLLNLHCKYCRLSDDCVLNWTSLKSLKLEHLYIRDEHIAQLASSCPQLESLELHNFCGFHRLHLTSPKCRRLQLTDHWHTIGRNPLGDGRDCWLEIVAPYVQHLKISGRFRSMKIRISDLSPMVHADFNFTWYRWEIHDFKDLLASVSCVSELTVPSWFIEVISKMMLEGKDLSLPLLECKQLTINCSFTMFSLLGVGSFLRSTPKLEHLIMLPAQVHPAAVELIHGNTVGIDFLVDHFLSLHQDIVKGSLQNLKNAKVILVKCISYAYMDDSTGLARFLKYLLENAINLKKLVISDPLEWQPPQLGSNMIDDLIALPKASNSAVVSFEPVRSLG